MTTSRVFTTTYGFVVGLLGLGLMLASGCKNSPTDSPPSEAPNLQGTYIGHGTLSGSAGNILAQFLGPDSTGEYTGAIRYHSTITTFDDVYRTAEGDTVFCRFQRNGTTYRFWSCIETTGMFLNFSEPLGVATLRVNRESPGFNMTGFWSGLMSSATVPDAVSASLLMDQRGQIFWGTLDVALPDNPDFEFNSGAAAGASFQISGSAWIFSQQIPAEFAGTYLAQDTIRGVWQTGGSVVYDEGEFYFMRTYD